MSDSTGTGPLRVVVITGPEPGHAIPAVELCRRLRARGADPVLMTDWRWERAAADERLGFAPLGGLAPRADDDDGDAGGKLHGRAARMAGEIVEDLRALRPDVVVADTITVAGGLAAELLGVPWVELIPHPLYLPSRGLPPLGSGLAPGEGIAGRLRDAVLRAATRPQLRRGLRQRREARAGIGLPRRDPGPRARMIAAVPGLEPYRPDWPDNAYVVGPLVWDPTRDEGRLPPGDGPLILVAPSTATNAGTPMAQVALRALAPDRLGGRPVRVVVTTFGEVPDEVPQWAVAGRMRQDRALHEAAVVVCGAGHGMLAKAFTAGVPVVSVPGGGDQWELACRVERQGAGALVRPLTEESLTAAVGSVLDGYPRYAAAAERMRDGLRRVVDPVDVCERVARHAGG